MRALVQRVSQASVRVNGEIVSEIGRGLLVLLGVKRDDSPTDSEYLAKKIVALRIFSDSAGRNNLSVAEVGGDY